MSEKKKKKKILTKKKKKIVPESLELLNWTLKNPRMHEKKSVQTLFF